MKTKIQEQFHKLFGEGASLFASPGRVNLIGEHTDYNLGFVLPGAIDKAIYVAIKPNDGRLCRIHSVDYNETIEMDLNGEKPTQQWACYIYGVVQEMHKRGALIHPFDMVFGGDVPLGAGLSSSAALESVVGFALNTLFHLGFDRAQLAKIGQMTEHNYVGVRCGIMDQFASLFGEKGKVIRLDCRSLECTLEPFDPQGCKVVLFDTQVKHTLASSEYNVRRAQCEAGVAVVLKHVGGIESLRDVTMDMLNSYKSEMEEIVYRRCSFVINENQRVMDACAALEQGDYATFGAKMNGSHEGLSKWYEVSCAELDFLADTAHAHSGVLGARMMGGGFGGCTINLVKAEAYDDLLSEVKDKFAHQFGKAPRIIEVNISQGAHQIS
ncbi:MAG: galactokinase [Alistipes sp.]|nr:galactokinase [Alistipes sp.]